MNTLSPRGLVVVLFVFSTLSACSSHGKIDPQKMMSEGFVPMFNGTTLTGWHAAPEDSAGDWSIEGGAIVCLGSEDRLAYLVWQDEDLGDFELKFSYRMLTDGNTGVEVRARVDKSGGRPFVGYHADLGHVGIGPGVLGAWDFHFAGREEYACFRGTNLVIDPDGETHSSKIKDGLSLDDMNKFEWNHVHVVARGNHLWFTINGKMASEFTDNMPESYKSGLIGLQIHDKDMRVAFKDLWIKKLN